MREPLDPSTSDPSLWMSHAAAAIRACGTEGDERYATVAGRVMRMVRQMVGASEVYAIETRGERTAQLLAAVNADGRIIEKDDLAKEAVHALPHATLACVDGETGPTPHATTHPFTLGNVPIGVIAVTWPRDHMPAPDDPRRRLIDCAAKWVSQEWTRRVEAKHESTLAEQRYRALLQGASDGLFEWDLMTNKVHYSERWKQMIGYPADFESDSPDAWLNLIDSNDRPQVEADLAMCVAGQTASFRNEHRVTGKDGQQRWVLAKAQPVFDEDGQPVRLIGSLTDTTEFKSAEQKLRHAAEHDKLTGLPNRGKLLARLEQAIRRHRLTGGRRKYAAMFLDFDRFKIINDSLGHEAGDELLIQIAKRLSTLVRSNDMAARLGGDEFVVLLEELDEPTVLSIADRLLAEFGRPFTIAGHEVTSTASIGIVIGDAKYQDANAIICDADSAMYNAKAFGKARYVLFDDDMKDQSLNRLVLERELRHALENDEFFMQYQPIINVGSGSVAGFEALVRWKHPELGLVHPDEFISIAEETGLIVPIGRWILERACHELRQLDRLAPEFELSMNVNLSRRQLVQPDLIDVCESIIAETRVDPERIRLEVTESVIMDDRIVLTPVLDKLRELGFNLAMDDFGTGHSSLSCIHRFPIDTLKIDRSFVLTLEDRHQFSAVIRAVVTLAHALGMRVVAEGIENIEQLRLLESFECDLFQGYYFAKPLNLDEACRYVVGEQTHRLTA